MGGRDGHLDLIVGAFGYDNGQQNEGAIFVYLGSATGLQSTPTSIVESHETYAYLGWTVSNAGDVNADGYDDVIVGALSFFNPPGKAYLYLGSATGLNSTPAWIAEGEQSYAYFGWTVSDAGDVNADGYGDVIVGAPYYGNSEGNEGKAYLYLGSATGLNQTPAWTAEGQQELAYFGDAVSGAGDVNGDGYDDVMIGAYSYSNSQINEGRAFVYLGSATGLSATPAWTAESNQADAEFGAAVNGAGDVNGDGYDDVIVGAPLYDNSETDSGVSFLYLGSATGLDSTPALLTQSQQANAQFGAAVSSAGDVNGDGYDDYIVGAPYLDNAETDSGASFLYLGSATAFSATPAEVIQSEQAYAHFAWAVSTAGDLNSDGYDDVIIGAPQYDNPETNEGRVFVYYGAYVGEPVISVSPTTLQATLEQETSIAHSLTISNTGDAVLAWDITSDVPWASGTTGSTGINQSSQVDIVFDATGLASGTHNGTLSLSSNDSDATPILIPLTLTVTPRVSLHAVISPTLAFAGEGIDLIIEARDAQGALVTDYRGGLDINPTAGTTGLPQSSSRYNDYKFTQADAGRHLFENFAFNFDGEQTITVIDRSDSSIQGTSNSVTILPIYLHTEIIPTLPVYAGERTLDLVIEARSAPNGGGTLVPSYRGSLNINPSTSTTGLPQSSSNFHADYTFTAADAGRHVFQDFAFNVDGQQTITVIDRANGNRQTTSNAITILPVYLFADISPLTASSGEQLLDLVIEARSAPNGGGTLVPSYRGSLNINPSTSTTGLPQSSSHFHPDYTFSEADAGQRLFEDFAFNADGQQTITVIDRANGNRQATSNAVTIQEVFLHAEISPTLAFAGEPSLTLVVEARDASGELVPEYRGALDMNPSTGTTGLPQSTSHFHPDYTFTASDAGRHIFEDFAANSSGQQTITVIDRANSNRQATSNAVTIQEVSLHATLTPTSSFANQCVITLVIEARDSNGQLVPEYRGEVDINPTAGMPGLWLSTSDFYPDYVFTEEDAGQHLFSCLAFAGAGEQSVTVIDRANSQRQATSNSVTVQAIAIGSNISPTTVVAGDPVTLTIEITDPNTGGIITDYEGTVVISSTIPTSYEQSYTFTPADQGTAELSFSFAETGNAVVQLFDQNNLDSSSAAHSVTVTTPPNPTPIPPKVAPSPVSAPETIDNQPEPMPYVYAEPMGAMDPTIASNVWRGYPLTLTLASPGAIYLTQGTSRWAAGAWWSTYYSCAWVGWEDPLTAARDAGGGLHGPVNDRFAFYVEPAGCAFPITHGWSTLSLGMTEPAPEGTQGAHLNIHAGGNSPLGEIRYTANGPSDAGECDASENIPQVVDPVDTRTGAFYLNEHDLGLETGCQGISLRFERAYKSTNGGWGSLGVGWVHNYEQKVIPIGDYVALQRPRGSLVLFEDVGGDIYASKAGSRYTLKKRSEGGWLLIYQNRRIDVFDAAGQLVAQQDPNGNLIWMTYENYSYNGERGSRLARVDAPGGRYLWFGYDYYQRSQLIQVTDNSGRQVQFDYSQRGQLRTVTDTLGHASTYTYTDWLLSEKIDPLGTVVFNNSYDSSGRVIHQINNRGEDVRLRYEVTLTSTLSLTDTFSGKALPDIVSSAGSTTYQATPHLAATLVTDQTGAETIYLYNSDGLLMQVIDPLGAVTTYRGYGDLRQPTEIVDPLGHITQIQYNELRYPVAITDTLGNRVSFAYDSWSNPTQMTDPLGRSYHFTYDGPNLLSIENPLGETVELSYGAQNGWQGMLSAITNQAGISTTLTYDAAGDMSSITDALGHLTQMEYDEIGRPVSMTDARGKNTSLAYDVADRLTSMTDALSGTVQMEYDPLGNVVRMIDQIGATSQITYTQSRFPVSMTDANGQQVQIEYGALGRPITMTDQLGNQSSVEYDIAGRPIAQTDALGHTTRYEYDLVGNMTVMTDANGNAMTIDYDAIYRPTKVTNATGQFLRYGYDAANNVVAITDTLGASVQMTYDELGRTKQITDQVGATTTYNVNALGQVEEIIDDNSIVTRYEYDELGQIETVIANYRPGFADSADTNVRTRYQYDEVGNLTALTDPRNNITSFTYDSLGRLATTTDPLSRTMSYQYDARSLLTTWNKADGSQLDYTYDLLGQLSNLNAPDQTIEYQYDAAGRRTQMSDKTGSTSYLLDPLGRPLTITLPTSESVSYGYDAVGNRTQLVYPDGKTVNYAYDAANQLESITDWDNQITSYAYDTVGRLTGINLPNGVVSSLSYDAASQLESLQHTNASQLIARYDYSYDGTGRRTQVVEPLRTIDYTYDGLYRLTEADESTGDNYQYSYDAAGNRLSKNEPTANSTYTYDTANQLATIGGTTVSHDSNGNLLSDGTTNYTYDSLDRLISTSNGSQTTSYGYTGDGDRLWQRTGGITTTFTLDLNSALTQVLGQQGGGQNSHFLPGIGQQEAGAWMYYHTDALGSIRNITANNGSSLGEMRYSPFGERVLSSGVLPFMGFTGEPMSPTSDLTYLRARYYNPSLGRFLTQDAIVPDPLNGQAWNAYAYALNDPVNLVDPSGFASCEGLTWWRYWACMASSPDDNFNPEVTIGDDRWSWDYSPGGHQEMVNEWHNQQDGSTSSAWGLWSDGYHPFGCACENQLGNYGNLGTSLSLLFGVQVEKFSRLLGVNAVGYEGLSELLGQLGGKAVSGAIGFLTQALGDLFDCSLSLPSQLLRGSIALAEAALIAGFAGMVSGGGILAIAGASVILIGGAILASALNGPIFEGIEKIDPYLAPNTRPRPECPVEDFGLPFGQLTRR